MNSVVLLSRLVLAAVFAVAGVGKLTDRAGTRASLGDFGLPAGPAGALALVLPVVEITVAGLLLARPTAAPAGVACTVLLLTFSVAIARVIARGEVAECRCFGRASAAPVDRRTLARNGGLLALALVVAVGARDGGGASATAWVGAADPLVLVAAAVMAAHVAFSWQLFRQNGRLLERVADLEAVRGSPSVADTSGLLSAGTPAPAFTLPDVAGRPVSLEHVLAAGQGALLVFSDPGCAHCGPLLDALADLRGGPPRVIVSRGARPPGDAAGADLVLLQDDFEVADAYRVFGLPGAVLVGADGRIVDGGARGAQDVLGLARRVATPPLQLTRVGATG